MNHENNCFPTRFFPRTGANVSCLVGVAWGQGSSSGPCRSIEKSKEKRGFSLFSIWKLQKQQIFTILSPNALKLCVLLWFSSLAEGLGKVRPAQASLHGPGQAGPKDFEPPPVARYAFNCTLPCGDGGGLPGWFKVYREASGSTRHGLLLLNFTQAYLASKA